MMMRCLNGLLGVMGMMEGWTEWIKGVDRRSG